MKRQNHTSNFSNAHAIAISPLFCVYLRSFTIVIIDSSLYNFCFYSQRFSLKFSLYCLKCMFSPATNLHTYAINFCQRQFLLKKKSDKQPKNIVCGEREKDSVHCMQTFTEKTFFPFSYSLCLNILCFLAAFIFVHTTYKIIEFINQIVGIFFQTDEEKEETNSS